MQNGADAWVVFNLDEQEFAVALAVVERVVRAVEVTPIPEAPHGVRGVINFQGRIVPVFDLWTRFGLPTREVRTTDHLVIAHTYWRTVALLVNSVTSVVSRGEVQITPTAGILPQLDMVTGVMKRDGSLVLVHDLERFLSIEDHAALQLMLNPQP
ncbi:MAG: chemotaxis protein CheW [Prosthecobacter sp.]|uniref:chemotaxis protein CheW n=1 Tax=Prosthecobacter sp. TaxID=1965333 RepID=UPI00390185E0